MAFALVRGVFWLGGMVVIAFWLYLLVATIGIAFSGDDFGFTGTAFAVLTFILFDYVFGGGVSEDEHDPSAE